MELIAKANWELQHNALKRSFTVYLDWDLLTVDIFITINVTMEGTLHKTLKLFVKFSNV